MLDHFLKHDPLQSATPCRVHLKHDPLQCT